MQISDHIKKQALKSLPNKFMRQHAEYEIGGQERGGIPKARKKYPSMLDGLYTKAVIDSSQHVAGMRLRRYWEATQSGVRSCLNFDNRGSSSVEAHRVDILQAADYYRRLVRAMQKPTFSFLVMVCCYDYSPSVAAKKSGHDYRKARDILNLYLDELSDCIYALSNHKK